VTLGIFQSCAVASFQPNIGGSNISYTSYSTTSASSLLQCVTDNYAKHPHHRKEDCKQLPSP